MPRLDLSSVNQTLADAGLGPLTSLSQRKLNALGLPLAYVDTQQRYRFVNSSFLEWLGKREDKVIGKQIVEVVGAEVYQLYQAYVDAALAGERTGFVRQLVAPGSVVIISVARHDDELVAKQLADEYTAGRFVNHSAADILSFFTGWQLAGPGVTEAREWMTRPLPVNRTGHVLAGVGRI